MSNLDVIRVSITGPESSGKTSLALDLQKHFNATLVEEYARTHLSNSGKDYTQIDLIHIARQQMQLENEAVDAVRKSEFISNNPQFVFFDTDLYVLKIWSELAFGSCDSFILDHLANDSYDLHLLCMPDLPWEFDELREHPETEQRNFIYQHYLDAMQHQPKPWFVISGEGQMRFDMAVEAIDSIFQ